MPDDHPLLRIKTAHAAYACVIRLEGELDLAGCPALERVLRDSLHDPAEETVLDVEDLSFIDARGLYVIAAARHRSAAAGRLLFVTPGQGQVARLFQLIAIDACLSFTDRLPATGRSKSTSPSTVPNAVVHAFASGR